MRIKQHIANVQAVQPIVVMADEVPVSLIGFPLRTISVNSWWGYGTTFDIRNWFEFKSGGFPKSLIGKGTIDT